MKCSVVVVVVVEGSLEVKLPTIWTDEKQGWSRRIEKRREEKRTEEERRSEKRKGQKKEDAGARKGRKVAKHCVFPMICVSRGSKSRLAKAAGAEPAGQMRDEKLHNVVARSTYRSQNVQNTPFSDHFRFWIFFLLSFPVPFALYLQQFGTRTCHFAWNLLHFGMVTLHFAWYLLHLAMFAFHFAWYVSYFGISTSDLHGICYILVLQTFMWVS